MCVFCIFVGVAGGTTTIITDPRPAPKEHITNSWSGWRLDRIISHPTTFNPPPSYFIKIIFVFYEYIVFYFKNFPSIVK